MGKKSKEKGKRGEREWVNQLKRLNIPLAERTSYKQAEGGDVPPDVSHLFGAAEVKFRKRLTVGELYAALEQVELAKSNEESPIRYVAARRDHSHWMVVMTPEQFKELFWAYLVNRVLLGENWIESARVLFDTGEMLEGHHEGTHLETIGYILGKRLRIAIVGPYPDEGGCYVKIEFAGGYSSRFILNCDEAKERLWSMFLEATSNSVGMEDNDA